MIPMDSRKNELVWPPPGAILAGGRSRRMGSPKEGISLWDGRAMIEHVIDAVEGTCRRVVIVGECKGFDPGKRWNLCRVNDRHPGLGPLAGIEAVLESGLASGYLVVACDQPLLTSQLLWRLLAGDPEHVHLFSPESGGKIDPFPGYYPTDCLPQVRSAMQEAGCSVRDLIRRRNVSWTPISPAERFRLRSVNIPADLDEVGRLALTVEDGPIDRQPR